MSTSTSARRITQKRPKLGAAGPNSRPRWIVYALLAELFIGSTYPLYWSVVMGSSDKSALTDLFPPLFPGSQFWANVAEVFNTVPFWKALGNSLIVSGLITTAVRIFPTLVGYSL